MENTDFLEASSGPSTRLGSTLSRSLILITSFLPRHVPVGTTMDQAVLYELALQCVTRVFCDYLHCLLWLLLTSSCILPSGALRRPFRRPAPDEVCHGMFLGSSNQYDLPMVGDGLEHTFPYFLSCSTRFLRQLCRQDAQMYYLIRLSPTNR